MMNQESVLSHMTPCKWFCDDFLFEPKPSACAHGSRIFILYHDHSPLSERTIKHGINPLQLSTFYPNNIGLSSHSVLYFFAKKTILGKVEADDPYTAALSYFCVKACNSFVPGITMIDQNINHSCGCAIISILGTSKNGRFLWYASVPERLGTLERKSVRIESSLRHQSDQVKYYKQ